MAAIFLVAGCASVAPGGGSPPGIAYSRLPGVAEDIPQSVHVIEVDLASPRVALEVTARDPVDGRQYRAQTTSQYVARNGLQAAVNAAFFEPFRGGSFGGEDYYPRVGDPVDALPGPKPNGTVCIAKPARVTIEAGEGCAGAVDHSLTAGPMLLVNGQTQSWTLKRARHPRTAFGISSDRRRAWLVVVDGRQPSSFGATLEEMAAILLRLGASDAVNFDGGGSTTMVLDDGRGPRVVNSPIHSGIPGRERPGATHLGVRAAP